MATRPVFMSMDTQPYVEVADTEFKYYPGFAISQARKSIECLDEAFCKKHPEHIGKILEVSSKSSVDLGIQLSAFNLMYTMSDGSRHTVETVFQAGKCFENGKQYIDLLYGTSYEAKKDERLHNSGCVIGFSLEGTTFPTEPITFFYDWLYTNALNQNNELANHVIAYSAFTDIAFNPARSLNCQARSVAVFVGLRNSGKLTAALESPESFLELVYKQKDNKSNKHPTSQQISLWDYIKS